MSGALDRIRLGLDYQGDYMPTSKTHGEAVAALADLEALKEAAKSRLSWGHNDTCDWMLDREAGEPLQGYPCYCGHHELAAALARVLGGEQT